MKKIFEYFGLLCLLCFSFILTEETTTVVQEVDDIMIQIKSEMLKYNVDGMDAEIKDDCIIPGLVSKVVNVNKSYSYMKEKGIYDSSFYVYDLNKPNISLEDNIDKYIISGNANKRMVSIIFVVDNKDMKDILNVVGNTPVSFVIESYNIDTQIDNLIDNKLNNEILISNMNKDDYDLITSKLKSIGVNNIYCFNNIKDSSFLDICKKDDRYSLTTTIIESNPLKEVKKNLSAGHIFVFKINDEVIKELPNVIRYINSRNYDITFLKEHLSENW